MMYFLRVMLPCAMIHTVIDLRLSQYSWEIFIFATFRSQFGKLQTTRRILPDCDQNVAKIKTSQLYRESPRSIIV